MIYQKILKGLLYPIKQIRWHEKTFEVLRFMEKSQWWSLPELEQFQRKRLQTLLKHAYQNTSYYHRLFNQLGLKPKDIRNGDDLQRVPILTKEIIRNNLDDLVVKDQKVIPDATGGSTGEPMRLFVDRRSIAWNMAAAYREWRWAGYEVGDKIGWFCLAPQYVPLQTRIFNLTHRRIVLDASSMAERHLGEYAQMLRQFRPKVIQGYASALYLMARYMDHAGIDDIKPRVVLTSSEMLFDYQRETLERVFGCEVFDYYSGRDTTLQAGECHEHSGYHLAIENAVIEFIKDGEHASSGEFGKIILTDLSNYAMPFIRYEIGDLGVPSDETCSCGRGLPLMKKVLGRISDIITTKGGNYIHGEFFTHLFYDTRGIEQFQFIQKTKDCSILKIVRGENYLQRELDTIIEKIYERCEDMKIEVEFVESIPLTRSGKYRFTISEVPTEF
jgi:phenylacetate-CoA ligase